VKRESSDQNRELQENQEEKHDEGGLEDSANTVDVEVSENQNRELQENEDENAGQRLVLRAGRGLSWWPFVALIVVVVFMCYRGAYTVLSPIKKYNDVLLGAPLIDLKHYVKREEYVNHLKKEVGITKFHRENGTCPSESSTSHSRSLIEVTGAGKADVWGWGGVGKTVIVLQFVRDQEVQAHYDAIFWITFGEDPFILDKLLELHRLICKLIPKASFPQQYIEAETQKLKLKVLKDHICELLGGKKYLLVVDDAWDPQDLKIFFSGLKAPDSVLDLVVTSRRQNVIKDAIGDTPGRVNIDLVGDEEAIEMILRLLGEDENDKPVWLENEYFIKVLGKCGGLPLALHMIAANFESTLEKAKR